MAFWLLSLQLRLFMASVRTHTFVTKQSILHSPSICLDNLEFLKHVPILHGEYEKPSKAYFS